MENNKKFKGFQIDRTISVGLLVTVAIQVGIIIYSAGNMSKAIQHNTDTTIRTQDKIEEINRDHITIRNDLYKIIAGLREDITELKYQIKLLEEKR